jgi:hypothetical protein
MLRYGFDDSGQIDCRAEKIIVRDSSLAWGSNGALVCVGWLRGKGGGEQETNQLESLWGRFVVFLAGFGDFSIATVNWGACGG